MRVHNLYTDSSGQSHFRDIEVEWVEETRGGKLSKRLPATGIIFREVPPTYDLDWHPAPRRQYIVNPTPTTPASASLTQAAAPSNPHRRQPPTRPPAGSFLGGFRTPALSARG